MVAVRPIKRKRLKKPPPGRVPKMAEARYLIALKRIVASLAQHVRELVLPAIPRILTEVPDEVRGDSIDVARFDEFDDALARTIGDVKLQFLGRARVATAQAADRAARETSDAQKRDHDRAALTVLGVQPERSEPWLRSITDNFVRANVRLVEDMSESALDAVEKRISAGAKQGLTASAIGAQIQSDLLQRGETVSLRKAKFIARDQVGSLYGELARVRQKKLGVQKYEWSTSQDERVRESHRERNGVVFTWDPIAPQLRSKGLDVDDVDGHPGIPIGCRCIALPVFDDLEEDTDDDDTTEEEDSDPLDALELLEEEPDEEPDSLVPLVEDAPAQQRRTRDEQTLAFGDQIRSQRLSGGDNESQLRTYRDAKGRETVGVWKPARGEVPARESISAGTYYRRERATYEIDRLMGGEGVVPTTTIRQDKDGPASVQAYIPDSETLMTNRYADDHLGPALAKEDSARRLYALDLITGNIDRHDGNVLVSKDDGRTRVSAIDNGLTLPKTDRDLWFRMSEDLIGDGRLGSAAGAVKSIDIVAAARSLANNGIEREAAEATLIRIRALQIDPDAATKAGRGNPQSRAQEFLFKSFRGGLLDDDEIKRVRKTIDLAYGEDD